MKKHIKHGLWWLGMALAGCWVQMVNAEGKGPEDMEKRLEATHGVVCRMPGKELGYFAWPTVARKDDGTLFVASSGLRTRHICPWGKTVLNVSRDQGATWSEPQVIQDSMIDDRDAGIVNLGDGRLLVSWFRSDTRVYANVNWLPVREWAKEWAAADAFAGWTDEKVNALLGSWIMLSDDVGKTWGEPIRVPVSAPHGPIRLRSGDLLYLGKRFGPWTDVKEGMIAAARSSDGGRTWPTTLGQVPVCPGTDSVNYHEPHVLELPSGRLLGMIRIEPVQGVSGFSMLQTESDDGGRTWTVPRPVGFHGSPPHLLRHSSGVLILTYGYRLAPFGQRVAFSYDDGTTWDHDWIIRDDAPDSDLGYPSTVELADGSLFTVYYQIAATGEKCSLLWSRWKLPKIETVDSSNIVLNLNWAPGNPRNSEGAFVALKDGRILQCCWRTAVAAAPAAKYCRTSASAGCRGMSYRR